MVCTLMYQCRYTQSTSNIFKDRLFDSSKRETTNGERLLLVKLKKYKDL